MFADTESRGLIPKWLFRIAYSDVHFHVDEMTVIDSVAAAAGATEDDVSRIREEARVDAMEKPLEFVFSLFDKGVKSPGRLFIGLMTFQVVRKITYKFVHNGIGVQGFIR